MADFKQLKETIKKRMAERMRPESDRAREIREMNSRSASEGLKIKARARHSKSNRTTLSDRKKWVTMMSKDS